ncbi:hypothetical protein KW782_02455 [Candidatus Parcubacteria bacterium]|nr:hypothetical protein [Candidatus Parcubacteria bacterium]
MHQVRKKGVGLVEIIIGSAIIVTGVLALSEGYAQYVKFALANEKNIQAAYLAEEAIEVVTQLRDFGWTRNIGSLATSTTHYLSWTGSVWATTTVPEYVDGIFLREIHLADVYRDGSDRITNTGTLDPNSRFLTVTISYPQAHATTTKSISTYISNLNSD